MRHLFNIPGRSQHTEFIRLGINVGSTEHMLDKQRTTVSKTTLNFIFSNIVFN